MDGSFDLENFVYNAIGSCGFWLRGTKGYEKGTGEGPKGLLFRKSPHFSSLIPTNLNHISH